MYAAVEPLERRTLFTTVIFVPPPPPQTYPAPSEVTLSADGTLVIRGNPGEDWLSVGAGVGGPGEAGSEVIHVSYGSLFSLGTAGTFAASAVKRVALEGGGGNDVLEVGILNVPLTIGGGSGNDRLVGSGSGEWLVGGDGNDDVQAGGGNDLVHGGRGDDSVRAADGNDTVLAGAGSDHLFGGVGQDYLNGGDGKDLLFGEDSNDFLEGGPDDDELDGGAGTDTLYGGDGNDHLLGGRGVGDSMRGGTGNDRFRAADAEGNRDSMWGEAGFDVLAVISATDADDFFARGPQTR